MGPIICLKQFPASAQGAFPAFSDAFRTPSRFQETHHLSYFSIFTRQKPAASSWKQRVGRNSLSKRHPGGGSQISYVTVSARITLFFFRKSIFLLDKR